VHVEAISSAVALTSSSPLTCWFSAFQRNNETLQVTRCSCCRKKMYRYLHILHRLYSWCLNRQCLYWRHCWYIIWADMWCILHSFFRVTMQYWYNICHLRTRGRISAHDTNTKFGGGGTITTQMQNGRTT
jgi:hypothetical protein